MKINGIIVTFNTDLKSKLNTKGTVSLNWGREINCSGTLVIPNGIPTSVAATIPISIDPFTLYACSTAISNSVPIDISCKGLAISPKENPPAGDTIMMPASFIPRYANKNPTITHIPNFMFLGIITTTSSLIPNTDTKTNKSPEIRVIAIATTKTNYIGLNHSSQNKIHSHPR